MLKTQAARLLGPRQSGRLAKACIEYKERELQVASNWIVITGAPGSGKTTIVDDLRRHGHSVVHDAGRHVLENIVRTGVRKDKARSRYMDIQYQVLNKMLEDASSTDVQELVFFDYALPDNLAFLYASGLDWPQEFVDAACKYRYKHAFLVQGEYHADDDPVRTEGSLRRKQLGALLLEIYEILAVPLTIISAGSPFQRMRRILDVLREIPSG